MRKPTVWVLTRSDSNPTVQSQKMVRGWKFWIEEQRNCTIHVAKSKALISSAPLFSPMQIVGFPMRRLIYFLFSGLR